MKCANVDVIDVKVLNDYKLHLTFDDGVSGIEPYQYYV